jgi:hypothetical protein
LDGVIGGQGDIASLTNASLLRGAHIVSALVKVCAPASGGATHSAEFQNF